MKISMGIIIKAFEWSCYLFVAGLFFSRALLSISCVLIFISGVSAFLLSKRKLPKLSIANSLFPLVYLAFVLSIVHTENYNEWLNLVYKNSPLFLISIGFLLANPLKEKSKHNLLLFFALLGFVCVIINTINSLTDYADLVYKASISQNISPIIGPAHSAVGLLYCLGIIILCWLFSKQNTPDRKAVLISMIITWLICLHIIAYRFALVSIYIIAFLYLVSIWSKKVGKLKSLITLILLLTIPIIAIKIIPSFEERVNNTVSDLRGITESKNPNYHSLGQRWAATKAASEIIKQHPIVGIAPADIKDEMKSQYEKESYLLIPENRILVHNQLLYYCTSFGIPFMILFISLLGFVFFKELRINPAFAWLILPFLFHMQIENTLQIQITGVAMLFIFSLFVSSLNNREALEFRK